MLEEMASISVMRFAKSTLVGHEHDLIANEVPVVLIYNGISHVVMMASPADLEHFAMGFSLSENIIELPSEIYGMDLNRVKNGIEVHIELSSRRFYELKAQRRRLTGRTGCGICGSEHIDVVDRSLSPLPFTQTISLPTLTSGLTHLHGVQDVGRQTGCTHAALWISAAGHVMGGFEDVGRHVALDKVLGFRACHPDNNGGAIVISSRASYEMVQKAVQCGVEILCAVSAPTALAVEKAKHAQLTLLGFCRDGSGVIYTYPDRIVA